MSKRISIIRTPKNVNFTRISRFTLEDDRLTYEARGLCAFLLAKPDNWVICLEHLIKSSPSGREKTKRILNELIRFKYIRKEEQRNDNGQFSAPIYTLYESPYDGHFKERTNPSTVNPLTVKPCMKKPSSENPPLIKKQLKNNTNKTTTTTTTTTADELVWPKNISTAERTSIVSAIKNEDNVVVQKILREVGGQKKFKKNAVSFFHFLLKLEKEGKFTPSVTDSDKSKSDAKKKGERNYKIMLKESERKAFELFEKYKE